MTDIAIARIRFASQTIGVSKTGHCPFQNRPLRSETGQVPTPAVLSELGHPPTAFGQGRQWQHSQRGCRLCSELCSDCLGYGHPVTSDKTSPWRP
jgi:hypothetical protein